MVAMPEVKKPRLMTPEEFLEWEYHQEGRYEYVDGRIVEMAGEAPEHNQIAGNVYRKIGNRNGGNTLFSLYRRRPCSRVRTENFGILMSLRSAERRNSPIRAQETLLNPQVLIEVLSGSTREIDLVDKLEEYLSLVSVTDYLIFEQNQMRAIHHRPTGPRSYSTQICTLPEDRITLESIGVTLNLADIYRKVALPTPETESGEPEIVEINGTETEPV